MRLPPLFNLNKIDDIPASGQNDGPRRPQKYPGLWQLNVAFGTALFLLLLSAVMTLSSLLKLSQSLDWVSHTQDVINVINTMEDSVMEIRAGTRGFILTGRYEYLDPVWVARERLPFSLEQYILLTKDNPEQQLRASEIKPLMTERLERADQAILDYQLGGRDRANEKIFAPQNQLFNRHINELLSSMRQTEERLLERRRSALANSTQQTALFIVVASLLACVVVYFARRSTARDLKTRFESQLALRESEERLQLVSQATQDAVWDWDHLTEKVRWNSALTSLFGYPSEEPLSLIDELMKIHPEDRAEVSSRIRAFTKDPTVTNWSLEYRFLKRGGEIATVFSRAFVIRDAAGLAVRVVGAMMDVSERRALELQLIDAREEALAGSRMKSEFLANMSHEIRTPMNGVIGMTGLLLDAGLNETQRDFAETIRASADSLLVIINDILDFSKIEAGKLAFETMDFDLRAMVESALDLLSPVAHKKGLELAFEMAPEVPRNLRGDAGRLRQIMMNLLSNAVKFTGSGEVTVRVMAEKSLEESTVLRFEVRDTGIGITKQVQMTLFQAFVQADGSTVRKFGGTGLGLAISRQLVELMGGEIGVESSPGHGSTFWFRLRLDHAHEAPEASSQTVLLTAANLSNLKVLVVDDNETNRRILSFQLDSWKMTGEACASPVEALKILRAAKAAGSPFDLAILDMQMPDMDGVMLAREIKKDAQLSHTRLMLMTSMGLFGRESEFKDAGFSEYLSKPVKQSQLLDVIARTMSTQPSDKLTLENAGDSSTGSKKVFAEPPRARSGLRILIAEDNPINQRIAVAQLAKLGFSSDAVANGLEALEALARIPYDLVLMDCQMPEMDGYDATRELRRREVGKLATPVIAMTANAMEGDRERCLEAGMNDHVSKPVKTEVLERAILKWLEIRRRNKDARS